MRTYSLVTEALGVGNKIRRRFSLVRAFDTLIIRDESGVRQKRTFDTAAEAKAEHDRIVARLVAEGFQPGKEGADTYALEEPHPDLEATIAARPDEPEAYLMYADWLYARGDPRGELITLQHLLRFTKPQPPTPFKRIETVSREYLINAERRDMLDVEARVILRHRHRFLGPLAIEDAKGVDLRWQFGFVRRYRALPVTSPGAGGFVTPQVTDPSAALMSRFLRHPSARFVQEIEFQLTPRTPQHQAMEEASRCLTTLPVDLPLRIVAFTRFDRLGASWPVKQPYPESVFVTPLWERYPGLRCVGLPDGTQIRRP